MKTHGSPAQAPAFPPDYLVQFNTPGHNHTPVQRPAEDLFALPSVERDAPGLVLRSDMFEPRDAVARKRHTQKLGNGYPPEARIRRNNPLADGHEVFDAIGMDVGAVLAIVELPIHDMDKDHDTIKLAKFYVVDPAQRVHGEYAKGFDGAVMLVSATQMQQMHEYARGVRDDCPMQGVDMPLVARGKPNGQMVGSAGLGTVWAPASEQQIADASAAKGVSDLYRTISGYQTLVHVTEQGDVLINDMKSHNGTTVIHGRPAGDNPIVLSPMTPMTMPRDPWANKAPIGDKRPWEDVYLGDHTQHAA